MNGQSVSKQAKDFSSELSKAFDGKMVLGQLDYPHGKDEVGLLISVTHKTELEWIKHINARVKTIKTLEEYIAGKLHDIGLCNDFLRYDAKSTGNKREQIKEVFLSLS